MKPCTYCGKENEEVLAACIECGAVFDSPTPPIPAINPSTNALPPLLPLEPTVLNGLLATLVLAAYLAAQFAGGIVMGIVSMILAAFNGEMPSPDGMSTTMQDLMPATIVATLILGGIAVVVCAWKLRFPLKDTSPTGAAWVRGSNGAIARGLGIGLLVGVGTVALAMLFPHEISEEEVGPLTRMGMTPGISQVVWILTALVLAPPTEELLFRGILYAGYRKSLGPIAAVLLTTFIFVMLHITELIHDPFASFGIIALALAALWWRLRSAAIGPAIAVHIGYNTIIVATTLWATQS